MESSLESWNKQFVERRRDNTKGLTNLNNTAGRIIVWGPLEEKDQAVDWLQFGEILLVKTPPILMPPCLGLWRTGVS